MQFAGQRTDMDLNPIGEPDNVLIKLTPEVLPDPYAILVTGITPQQTLADGITEAEFLKHFFEKIITPDTIMVGFNNVRFDDEFMRFMLWRNFYDAYEWQWKNNCSRWDLLDMVRMTRALRPEGIEWPFAPDGKPSNRLELLSAVNKLEHVNAHDALSDVTAAIDVARLIKDKQPKLFEYLLNARGKTKVSALVGSGEPFIYTSGRYPSEYTHTTAAVKVADHPERQAAIVYDLRVDPTEFINLSPEELAEKWSAYGKDVPYFPVKVLIYNKCPAVASLRVLDAPDSDAAERLQLQAEKIKSNLKKLPEDFGDKLVRAVEIMNSKRQVQPSMVVDPHKVDEQLYDGFVNDSDKTKMSAVRAASVDVLADLQLDFADERLSALLPLYKARNYPKSLNEEEVGWWEGFKYQKLLAGGENSPVAKYFARLNELAARPGISDAEKYVLEELRLYGESITPVE
ncbi:MAG: Exodeoxyribonuclease [Candidatus Saccharibacteria bacterium]|nr:Exodeoxyribonuclease [Candidatus Saccharibacteria bacterium]